MAEKLGSWRTREALAGRGFEIREATAGMFEWDLGDGWMVAEIYERIEGRPVVAELRIFPRPPKAKAGKTRAARCYGERSPESNNDAVPSGGITGTLLREVKPGMRNAEPVIDDYRDALMTIQAFLTEDVAEVVARLDKQIGRPSRAKTGEGRRQTDRYYSEIAVDYERLCAEGNRAPVKTMAEERGLDIGRMRSHIHRARRNGFLSDVYQGQTGGFATEKALKTLKGDD